jgi:tetratricopeptide (TPR) repeat protein
MYAVLVMSASLGADEPGVPSGVRDESASSAERQRVLAEFCTSVEAVVDVDPEARRRLWRGAYESAVPRLESDDELATLLRLYADHAASQGDIVEAVRVYQTLVAGYPRVAEHPRHLAELIDLAERSDDFSVMLSAALSFEDVAANESQRLTATEKVALALFMQRNYAGAAEIYRSLASRYPDQQQRVARSLNNISGSFSMNGEPELAYRLLKDAYAMTDRSERSLTLYRNLVSQARQCEAYEDAIGFIHEMKAMYSDHEQAASFDFILGTIHHKLQRHDEARSAYQAVIDAHGSWRELERYRSLAADNLRAMTEDSRPSTVRVVPSPTNSLRRVVWLLGNVSVLTLLAVMAWRRSRSRRG